MKINNTRELIGAENFSRNGITVCGGTEIVYFIVQPSNISVLSDTSIGIKISYLTQLLSVQPDIEIICSDARESFEANKQYLAERIEKEENRAVTALLKKDRTFLDNIQLQMSTAREFMFAVRVSHKTRCDESALLAGERYLQTGYGIRV